ncbi:LacI family DNA-binding transcriptional regulator [Salinispirillum marinum]|uniref:LacI family DNA-binding transcriptional regulator n=2 Tax=Saccharospirillaceae TaxID=255527 RepID=A0ABV8BAH0_9GAMM
MKLTLKDIAHSLGVSTATVSNAFSRPDQLSADLRERILGEAKRLGYRGPNATARSLRSGKTGTIALVLTERLQYNFEDPVATRFLHGVSEIFDQQNINMLLLPSRAEFYRNNTVDSLADGFVIYGPPRDSSVLERIVVRGKPTITVDFNLPEVRSLNIDNFHGARDAARHGLKAIENGPLAVLALRVLTESEVVGRIQDDDVLASPYESVSRRRLDGYRAALEETKRSLDNEWVWNVPESRYEYGYQAAREALMSNPRPKLLLCMSDRLALGAIAAAQDLGLNIPQDLKVIGFDDIATAAYQRPALTTVHQPQNEKGRQAAKMVLGLSEYTKDVLLEAKLIVRDSC